MSWPSSRLAHGVGALFAAGFGLLSMRPVSSFDFWWHLSMGRATAEAGSRSFPEPVGLAAVSTYVDVEWLFDLVLFTLYDVGGLAAVNLVVGLLAAVSFLICWQIARSLCGSGAPWTALALAVLVAGAAHHRFVPRPQVAFLVFLPLAIYLGLRVRRDFKSSAVGLVALFAVWAQTHASIIIAPGVAFAALLTGLAGSGSGLRFWKLMATRHWVLLAVLSGLTLTSAYGVGILALTLDHTDPEVIRHVQEMRPFQWSEVGLSVPRLCLGLLLGTCLLGVLRSRRLPIWPAALVVLGLSMASSSMRFLVALAYLSLPLAATLWGRRSRWSAHPGRESRIWQPLALLLAVAVPALIYPTTGAPSFEIHDPSYPIRAADALESLDVRGPLFNDYNHGGYLGWRLYGRSRVLIDGRLLVLYNGEEFYASRRANEEKQTFDALHRAHAFAAAVVPRDEAICLELSADPDWSTAWTGERQSVFLPTRTAPRALTRLPACRDDTHAVVLCRRAADLDGFLREVEAARQLSPGDPYLARLGAELALQCPRTPNLRQALAYLQDASAEPDHPEFAFLSAYSLLVSGKPEQALEATQEVTLDHLRTQTLRLRVMTQLGRNEEAAALGRRLVDRHDDHTPPELRDLTAGACEAVGNRRCAVHGALRASLEGFEPSRARLRSYLDRGWVPPEYANLARAAAR